MSVAKPKRTVYDEPIEAELARWPGVRWRREVRSKHYALVLEHGGLTRIHIYPSTPGDTVRGPLNQIRDLRAQLKEMGAERIGRVKSTSPKRERNKTTPTAVDLGERAEVDPSRDPWAALTSVRKKLVDQAPFILPIPASNPLPLWKKLLALSK